jgi:cullin-associated NEDD8-dissociated protein 1
VDAQRVVRLDSSATTGSSLAIYYEYVRASCIELAFPEADNSITVSEIAPGGGAMCADARLPVAGGACCDSSGNVFSICVFQGERVTYATAKKRCEDIGMTTCPWDSVETNQHCGTDLAPWEWYVQQIPLVIESTVDHLRLLAHFSLQRFLLFVSFVCTTCSAYLR